MAKNDPYRVSPFLPENCSRSRHQITYIIIRNDVHSKKEMSFEPINYVQSLKEIHDKFINLDMYFYDRKSKCDEQEQMMQGRCLTCFCLCKILVSNFHKMA